MNMFSRFFLLSAALIATLMMTSCTTTKHRDGSVTVSLGTPIVSARGVVGGAVVGGVASTRTVLVGAPSIQRPAYVVVQGQRVQINPQTGQPYGPYQQNYLQQQYGQNGYYPSTYNSGSGVTQAGPGYPAHAVRDAFGTHLLVNPDINWTGSPYNINRNGGIYNPFPYSNPAPAPRQVRY